MANLDGLKALVNEEANLETGAAGRLWRYDLFAVGDHNTPVWSQDVTETGGATSQFDDAAGGHFGPLAANSVRASADCLTNEAASDWGNVDYIKIYVKPATGGSYLLFAEGTLTDTGTGLDDVKTNQRVKVTQVDVSFTT